MTPVLTSLMVPPHLHEQVEAPRSYSNVPTAPPHPAAVAQEHSLPTRGQHRQLAASACPALSIRHFFTKHNKLNKLIV
jgi:hypothetical protein